MENARLISSSDGIKIFISGDRLFAYIEFSDEIDGSITVDKILDALKSKDIIFGLKPDNIKDCIENERYNESILVASGHRWIEGKDAQIEFYTEPQRIDYTSEEHQNDRINYREFFPIKCVKSGDLLAKKTPLVEGEHGIDVYGGEILPPSVKDVNFTAGENTSVSDDGLELFATISGIPIRRDKSVKVSPVYTVKRDVDFAIGNIDFIGSVKITGNVLQGFRIKATEDIVIDGLVEGAEIISGHNVVVQNGIVGGESAYIEAKGDVSAKFINGASVKAGGVVKSVGSILSSTIEAGVGVVAEGDKGIISGSKISASEYVIGEIFGSDIGTPTEISVGYDQELFDDYARLMNEIWIIESELEELQRGIKNLDLSEEKMNQVPKYLKERYDANSDKIKELKIELSKKTDELKCVNERIEYIKIHSFIQANKVVYPDVVTKIYPLACRNTKRIDCVRFVRDIEKNCIKQASIFTSEEQKLKVEGGLKSRC